MTDLSPRIIDTPAAIGELIELLTDVPNNPPSIYVTRKKVVSKEVALNLEETKQDLAKRLSQVDRLCQYAPWLS